MTTRRPITLNDLVAAVTQAFWDDMQVVGGADIGITVKHTVRSAATAVVTQKVVSGAHIVALLLVLMTRRVNVREFTLPSEATTLRELLVEIIVQSVTQIVQRDKGICQEEEQRFG